MQDSSDSYLKAAFMQVSILSAVFAFSVLVCVGAGFFVVQTDSAPAAELDEMTFWVLMGLAVISLFLGPIIGKMTLDKALQSPVKDEQKIAGAYLTSNLLRLVFQELAAIIGLGMTISTGVSTWAGIFGVLTLIAYALAWPKKEQMEHLLSLGATQ